VCSPHLHWNLPVQDIYSRNGIRWNTIEYNKQENIYTISDMWGGGGRSYLKFNLYNIKVSKSIETIFGLKPQWIGHTCSCNASTSSPGKGLYCWKCKNYRCSSSKLDMRVGWVTLCNFHVRSQNCDKQLSCVSGRGGERVKIGNNLNIKALKRIVLRLVQSQYSGEWKEVQNFHCPFVTRISEVNKRHDWKRKKVRHNWVQ